MTCAWGCTSFAPDDWECQRYGLGAMALRYAWMGYAVLPLQAGGKRPHKMLGNRGGVHLAERDRNMIKSWWLQDRGANVGVACGSVSKLCVIDLDVKHGVDGLAEWARFVAGSGLPWWYGQGDGPVPHAATPSGGCHLWLRVPEGARVPDRPGILPGVDVKGDGGYVCAFPSALAVQPIDRPGERGSGEVQVPYEWVGGCPHDAPMAPPWLLPWLESAAASGTSHPDQGDSGDVPDERTPLEVGSRNQSMYRLACSLYGQEGKNAPSDAQVIERLRAVWEKTEHSGYPWSEVLTSAESARRFIGRSRDADTEMTRSYTPWIPGWMPA